MALAVIKNVSFVIQTVRWIKVRPGSFEIQSLHFANTVLGIQETCVVSCSGRIVSVNTNEPLNICPT